MIIKRITSNCLSRVETCIPFFLNKGKRLFIIKIQENRIASPARIKMLYFSMSGLRNYIEDRKKHKRHKLCRRPNFLIFRRFCHRQLEYRGPFHLLRKGQGNRIIWSCNSLHSFQCWSSISINPCPPCHQINSQVQSIGS